MPTRPPPPSGNPGSDRKAYNEAGNPEREIVCDFKVGEVRHVDLRSEARERSAPAREEGGKRAGANARVRLNAPRQDSTCAELNCFSVKEADPQSTNPAHLTHPSARYHWSNSVCDP